MREISAEVIELAVVPQDDDENQTNGIEDIVDWDDIEELFDEGKFLSKGEVKTFVRARFEEAEEPMPQSRYREVLAGLFQPYRDLYWTLPDHHTPPPAVTGLDFEKVRQIRSRYAAGERTGVLALEFGIKPRTINDIVRYVTWKEKENIAA